LIADGQLDPGARFGDVRLRSPQISRGLQGREVSAHFDPDKPASVSGAELLSPLTE
jgi:hypothetical protein